MGLSLTSVSAQLPAYSSLYYPPPQTIPLVGRQRVMLLSRRWPSHRAVAIGSLCTYTHVHRQQGWRRARWTPEQVQHGKSGGGGSSKGGITRRWTHSVLCLGWLNIFWKSGGSCKGCAVPPAYAQSCPAVIWGVLQLWRKEDYDVMYTIDGVP
jgi:hypothetical protein